MQSCSWNSVLKAGRRRGREGSGDAQPQRVYPEQEGALGSTLSAAGRRCSGPSLPGPGLEERLHLGTPELAWEHHPNPSQDSRTGPKPPQSSCSHGGTETPRGGGEGKNGTRTFP